MRQPIQSSRTINRRRHFRREDCCEVQLQTIDAPPDASDACSHNCLSRDVSAGGMRLLADRPYSVDSKVLITMECRENGWTRITSRVGTVVWSKLDAPGTHCQLGIHFTDIDSSDLEELV